MRARLAIRTGADQMPKPRADQTARKHSASTPGAELERLRSSAQRGSPRQRCQLAVLEASAEFGYPKLSVRQILDRAEVSRSGFYKLFANREECFAEAYAAEAEALAERLLTAARATGEWRAGLRAALTTLADFIDARPALAGGVLAQVHVAGGPAMAKRKEVLERLSRAVDSARRETGSRHSPPPIAATFIVSAIEAAAVDALAGRIPGEFRKTLPDLTHLAVSIYFGEEAALAEIEAWR